jgi:DNA-binding MarR family transcriptional regulator
MQQGRAAAPSWALTVPPGARTPGARTLAVLSGDESDGGTHELVASALTGLLQAGWSDEQACRAVEDSPGLSWRVGAADRRGWGWLLRIAEVQRAWLAEHPASDYAPAVRVEVAAARQALHAWAPSDELREQVQVPQLGNLRAVGDALLALADELGRTQHLSVGVRELAERAGLSVGTVRKALPVWRAVGLLVQVEPSRWADGVQLAATYRLELSAVEGDGTSSVLVSAGASATVGHDAWRHGALGHGGWDAWALLHPDEPADPDELAQLLGVHRRTVLRRLQKLELHRLVRRTPYGWTRCTEQDAVHLLELAAVHEQSDGAGERQRERHAAERTQRREQHERWVAYRKAEHRRELLEHAVREPDELAVGTAGWLPLDELVGELRGRGDELARERAPAASWAEPDELTAPELVAELVRLGEQVRSSALAAVAERVGDPFRGVQDALAVPVAQLQAVARTVQVFGEGVARWAAEHEHELADERERQGAPGG